MSSFLPEIARDLLVVLGGAWAAQACVTGLALYLNRWATASIWPALFCGWAAAFAWVTACALSYGVHL